MVTNQNYGGIVIDRVAELAYESYLGSRRPELEPVELDPAPYLGRYEARMADVELVQTDTGLELHYVPKGGFPTPETPPMPAPPPATVKFASENELFADDLWKGERIRSCATRTADCLDAGRRARLQACRQLTSPQ